MCIIRTFLPVDGIGVDHWSAVWARPTWTIWFPHCSTDKMNQFFMPNTCETWESITSCFETKCIAGASRRLWWEIGIKWDRGILEILVVTMPTMTRSILLVTCCHADDNLFLHPRRKRHSFMPTLFHPFSTGTACETCNTEAQSHGLHFVGARLSLMFKEGKLCSFTNEQLH